jgi:hypothetical protein
MLCIPGKELHYKGLGHNSKASDFHFTCPLIPEKVGKRTNSISIKLRTGTTISAFEVKSS